MYLTPAALGYLAQCLLAALIGIYLLLLARRPARPRHVLLLGGVFGALALFFASLGAEAALLPTPRLPVVFVQNTLLGAALVLLLQFAYHFPALALRREARLALAVTVVYTLAEGAYAAWRFWQLGAGQVLYRPNGSDYALLALFLWVPVAFCRQIAVLEGGAAGRPGHWLRAILRPTRREVRALRTFAALFLFVAGLNVFTILRASYLVTVALANLGMSLGILLALFTFAVAYLNHWPETTSFMARLAGLTLTVVLALLGVVGWVIAPRYEAGYRPQLPDHRTVRFTPNQAGGYDLADIPFAFEQPLGRDLHLSDHVRDSRSAAIEFPFVFYGQEYRQVYVANDGVLSLGRDGPYRAYQYHYGAGTPHIFPLLIDLYPELSPGGVFARQEAGRLIVTWDRLPGYYQQQAWFTFQVVLHRDGVFDITYNGLPGHLAYHANDEPGASLWVVGAVPGGPAWRRSPQRADLAALPLASGPAGVVQDYGQEFRQHLHRLLAPLAWLTLAATALVAAGFPLLFYVNLVSPLNALLGGVRRLEAGDYAVDLPVRYPDEIGFLTRAFNRLAAEMGDLIGHLEARVAARTAELDQANSRLRAEIVEREAAQATVVEQQRALGAFEERERLGRDLHDGLGQVMGYLNVQAQATQALLAEGQVQAAGSNLAGLARAAQEAHASIRRHILGLRAADAPPRLPGEPPDLLATIQDYVEQFGARSGVQVALRLPEGAPSPLLAPGVEEQVLRIVQEALANVHKHAGARRVNVSLGLVEDYVQVVVDDDGSGFAAGASPPPGEGGDRAEETHLGLRIMRERAEQIGGRLEIRSAPGTGTQVMLTVPRFLPTAGGEAEGLKSLRLLLADDHPLFLEGLRNLLLARGLTVVGTARDGQEALDQARALRPDVVVMDLNMPRRNGLEATRAIKAELPQVKVVILTVAEDEEHLFEAIKSGASGYLLKSLEANQFSALLTGLLRGEAPLSPGVAERILNEFARRMPAPEEAPASAEYRCRPGEARAMLTPRQWEILCLVADGLAYKEIGAALHLSEKTIKYHMAQILERLHVENRAQAIAYAHRARQE